MPKIDLNTRTARFFLTKYGKPTIRAAVEAAASRIRERLLPGMEDYCHIPVDLNSIAKYQGISTFNDERITTESREAELFAKDTWYYLRIGPNSGKFRKRFSIAHEIGHTLFRTHSRHEISVLSRREIEVEEKICDMFASALLMPFIAIKDELKKIKNDNPWHILRTIESASQRMQVSIPALLVRIEDVGVQSHFPLIVLCLRFFPNPKTGIDPCLRVDISLSLGSLRETRTWHNKSATGLHLFSAEKLFKTWQNLISAEGEPTGGKYVLVNSNLGRASEHTLQWSPEEILLDIREKRKWRKELLQMQCCSCLYAAKGWGEKLAYVVTLLKQEEPGSI